MHGNVRDIDLWFRPDSDFKHLVKKKKNSGNG